MARLRVAHLRFLVPFIAVAWRVTQPVGDNSFLWHVRAGTLQLDMGQVLTTDPFSFTASGEAWRTQSWLAELGYGWLERLTGGIGWVPTMKFVAVSLALGLITLVVHRVTQGNHWVTLGALILLIWQSLPFTFARPALLGFVFLACAVAATHSTRRPLWTLPLLFWLWASVHGLFVVGLAYLFLDALRRRSRRQLTAVGISVVAATLTAHGIGVWAILIRFLGNRSALDLIPEWQPPNFSNPFVAPLLVVIVGLLVVGAVGRLAPTDLWVVIPFVSFGVMAGRNVWPAVIVLLPIATRAFAVKEVAQPPRTEAVAINWALAVILVGFGVLGLIQVAPLDETRFPAVAATAALEPGRAFNDTAVGGYLIYADWPAREVFIDDRAELYGASGLERFHDLKSGVGVEETFDALAIDQAIVPGEWAMVEALKVRDWQVRYEDDFFVVMARP